MHKLIGNIYLYFMKMFFNAYSVHIFAQCNSIFFQKVAVESLLWAMTSLARWKELHQVSSVKKKQTGYFS